MTTTPPPSTAATYESEEERSLLFSDSEQESSQAGDADDIQDDNNLQWEDFMTRYFSNNNHDNNNDELQITANAGKILMMEDTDMVPHPLEPELDIHNPISLSDALLEVVAADNMALSKVLSEVGLESTLQMAKLHPSATADHHYHYSKSTVKKKEAESTKSRQTKKMMKQQLIEEFAIDMANVPIISSSLSAVPNRKSKQKKRASKIATAAASGLQVSQEIMSSPGKSGSTNYQQQSSSFAMMQPALTSSPRQQEETPLEDSLLAMAKRLSPGNDAPQKQQQQQQQAQHNEQRPSQQHRRQHSTSSSIIPSPQSSSDSPLPNPDLIHQMGPIQTRTSLRSLLMKKWHPSWWMHYDTHSLLIFRSKDHLDDWVQNPYHGKRERAYLVKLRVDFGDIVGGASAGASGGGGDDGHAVGDSNNAKEAGGILGHRILPVKKKSYNKNEPEMYQFKLERWTNMGVSVLAAFASEEEADVQLLYDTITEIMLTCPFGGLHNIDHMLKH